jgi:hypothetical protein
MVAIGRDIRARAEQEGVPPQRRLFSTFASGLEVVAGALHPTGNEYVVHVLGAREKQKYLGTFLTTRPLYVTTVRADFGPWEPWLRNMFWDFYRELIPRYEPVDRTFYSIVWAPRRVPFVPSGVEAECTIVQEAPDTVALHIHLPADKAAGLSGVQILDLELEYKAAWTGSPLAHGVLRQYLVAFYSSRGGFGNIAGLPLDAGRWRLPVEIAPGGTETIRVQLQPADVSVLLVRRCSARTLLPKEAIDGFISKRLWPAYWNDPYVWSNGVARSGAGFLAADASDLRDVRPGTRLRFARSGVRQVRQVSNDAVWVDGTPLDAEGDGFPHAIDVLDGADGAVH